MGKKHDIIFRKNSLECKANRLLTALCYTGSRHSISIIARPLTLAVV